MSPSAFRQPGDVVNQIYSERIQSMIQVCLDAGDDPQALMDDVKRELQKMVSQMMAEDHVLLESKRAEMILIRTRHASLYHELYPDKTCPDYADALPVLQALRTYLQEYETLKEEHGKLLEREVDIRREERALCNELNERSLQVENSSFVAKPLIAQMSLLAEHVAELRDDKRKRIDHLAETSRLLHQFEEVYGWKRPTAVTMIGKLLAFGLDQLDSFTLTREAMKQIDEEFAKISEQIHQTDVCFEQSHKQLEILIRKHQSLIPNDKVLNIAKRKQCRISKLPDLVAEVDRYTEHAMDKLTGDILKTRERIHATLHKLSMNEFTNNCKYAILNTSDFTEDVYFMHEELLQELETQYEVNRSLYEQIEIWNEVFLEFQEFEKSASDPQRFHRRGYSALTEERARKKLEGTLRECEGRLQHLADDFIVKHDGQAFVLSATGETIAEYIQHRKEDYARAKEREREAAKTPSSKKKARTDTVVRARPAPLQSVPGSDEHNTNSEESQCATTLCVPALRKKKCLS